MSLFYWRKGNKILRECNFDCTYRVMCPNFGHPALTSSLPKYKILQTKNSFATIENGLSVLKLFQLSNGDVLFSYHADSIYKVHEPKMTKLGQGIEVRTHYPR